MDDKNIESSTEEDSSIGNDVLLSARIRQLEAAKDEDSAGKQSDLGQEEDDSNDVSDNFDNFVNMKRVLDMIHIVLTDKEDEASDSSDIKEPPVLPCQEPEKVLEDSEEVNTSSSEDSGSTVKAWRILTDRVRRKRSGTAVSRKGRRPGQGSAYSATKKRSGTASRSTAAPPLRRSSRSTVTGRASPLTPSTLDAEEDLEGGAEDHPSPPPQLPPLPPLSTAGMLRRAAERGAAPPPGVRPLAAARRPVACSVGGPVLALLEALPPHGLELPAGLALLDVHFHMPTNILMIDVAK
ncbi:uncharacterized protein LOC126291451 [Schistocerca gregaria]|uniref:uncharacterized protein LOC126291451 n=1 Tax=Schistocerca gregaria TaxID=7010 RepID=UPI00211EB7C7|nr:uncharacterized protein LOC126291451 [Schistocerca gregaria]